MPGHDRGGDRRIEGRVVIGPTGAVRVMVATKPVDFRKGAEGLAALVRETMGADPFSGACYGSNRRWMTVQWQVKLAQSSPAPIAMEALAQIAELYRIESEIRGRPPEERRTARQETSRPIIDVFEPWLRGKLALVSQKSKLAEAIRYALSRWAGLGRFLDDGRVEIDSNVVERSIRPIALNRKNALFAGSDGAASIGRHSPRSSRPASSTASIRTPTSPTSSPASSPAIRRTSSTTCCPGPMPPSHSRPWPENGAYDTAGHHGRRNNALNR
jgi:hypothetical protein